MHLLKPTVKRDLSLFSVQAWQKGYLYYLPKKLQFRYPIIFHYDTNRVNFYHRQNDFNIFKNLVTQKLLTDDKLFTSLNTQFLSDIAYLRRIQGDLQAMPKRRLARLIGKIMSFYLFVVSDSFVDARPQAWESRCASEGVLYEVDETLELLLKEQLRKYEKDTSLSHFLTVHEAHQLDNHSALPWQKIEQRRSGYIVWHGTLTTATSFSQFCERKNWQMPEIDQIKPAQTLKGMVACAGKVTGPVVVVQNNGDLTRVVEGSILVSVMTNVTYIEAFKRAAAIVTDEGGITCHAAILAREMQKPCITGTQHATTVLQEGELVEVNANTGYVTRV